MANTDWKQLKKIDAHIHIVPDEVHEANPDADDVWVYADIHRYQKLMKENNIEKAVVMPVNDPWLMSMDFTADAVNKNLCELKQQFPGTLYAFADIDALDSSSKTVESICRAVEDYALDGIKIHPNNTRMALDCEYNREIFAFAQNRKIPVAIHSYPNSEEDVSAASRIVKIAESYPDLKLIVCHMSAFQWETLLPVGCLADLSAILPVYVRTYGIEKTNEILHLFGAERLLFATDYPDSRILSPDEIYPSYLDLLNQMDFTEEEAKRIAYGNAQELFG